MLTFILKYNLASLILPEVGGYTCHERGDLPQNLYNHHQLYDKPVYMYKYAHSAFYSAMVIRLLIPKTKSRLEPFSICTFPRGKKMQVEIYRTR